MTVENQLKSASEESCNKIKEILLCEGLTKLRWEGMLTRLRRASLTQTPSMKNFFYYSSPADRLAERNGLGFHVLQKLSAA